MITDIPKEKSVMMKEGKYGTHHADGDIKHGPMQNKQTKNT